MKALLALGLLVLLSGCVTENTEVSPKAFNPEKISYFRDSRTNLCFALSKYSRLDTGAKLAENILMASVPCSPEVLALIKKD